MSNRKAGKGRQSKRGESAPLKALRAAVSKGIPIVEMPTDEVKMFRAARGIDKLTAETPGIRIEVIPEDEIEGPEGDFASGDDAADREMVSEILGRLRSGDIWAWFSACVRVTFDGLTSDQYLGNCSYADETDFRNDAYFSDMVREAIDDLNAQIAKRAHFAACEHCAAVSKGASLPDPIAHA